MIPFALSQNKQLVSVHEVAAGLACNCICPACQSPLIARKGRRNAHHFAHYRQPECIHALESSLHHLAKMLIKRERNIVLPPLRVHGLEQPIDGARLFQFGGVSLEQPTSGIVPDIILETARTKLLVEVAVHHHATQAKIWQLQKARLAAIEIDVKSIHLDLAGAGQGAKLEAFKERIIHDVRHKYWLFHPKQHAVEYQLRTKACERKKVKHRQYGAYHHYQVDGCLLGKRFYRNGPLDGKSYANVYTHCQHCTHCFEIEYQKKHVGYRQIATQPKAVYCLAKQQHKFGDLRKWVAAQ